MAEETFSASIEDYLVGLADSLQQAQRQLSQLTVPGDGSRPSVSYQLPKLDFELKLSLEVTEESAASGGIGVGLRGRLLDATGSRRQSAEAASTISGTFVAVPVTGGKPPPVLTTALNRVAGTRQLSIVATVRTATGEPLAGVAVHFNTDRRLASALNRRAPSDEDSGDDPAPPPPPLSPGSRPRLAVVETDERGEAGNLVDASGESPGTRIPISIDALGRTTTIVFKVAPDDGSDA